MGGNARYMMYMDVRMPRMHDSRDGGGRATSGTVAEAQNAGNIGNISKFCALKIADRQFEEVPLGCNEVVYRLRELNADHGLIQRFLNIW